MVWRFSLVFVIVLSGSSCFLFNVSRSSLDDSFSSNFSRRAKSQVFSLFKTASSLRQRHAGAIRVPLGERTRAPGRHQLGPGVTSEIARAAAIRRPTRAPKWTARPCRALYLYLYLYLYSVPVTARAIRMRTAHSSCQGVVLQRCLVAQRNPRIVSRERPVCTGSGETPLGASRRNSIRLPCISG
jgi:hypothetical protein